jgi:hypothetical protein
LVIRGGVLALAVLATGAAPALAQSGTPDPVNGGTTVGGVVSSSLELVLTQPNGLSTFKKSGTYKLSFSAMATTTDDFTQLSIADGDATSGSKLGYMASGSKRLKDPLEARVGSKAFQPLTASVDPLLTTWSGPLARKPVTVNLSQKVRGAAKGKYRKLMLVTLSSETP